MTDETLRWCVLMPCSKDEAWAVTQICLAEIYTLNTDALAPPSEIEWRDRKVPVLDLGADDGSQWNDSGRGSGLIAIFLGLEGEECEYWGVAVRGPSLEVAKVASGAVEDKPEAKVQHASAAFEFNGTVYQVPDLGILQKKLADAQRVA